MVKRLGLNSDRALNNPQDSREPSGGDSETGQRTQVSATTVISAQVPSSSSSAGFSGRGISQGSTSSAARKTQQAAGHIMPPEEGKDPFDGPSRDPLVRRPSELPNSGEATEQLSQLLESRECKTLFSHILGSQRLTDQEKFSTIRKQLEQEVKTFGLPYNISVVRDITKYVNSTERRHQIALAEIDFVKALIEKNPKISSLQTGCALILGLDISEEEKAKLLSDEITKWQINNPDIVANVSSISLKGKNIKVIPKYIAGFTNLKDLNLSDNHITDISALATPVRLERLERLNLGGNKITDIAILANLVELKYLTLNRNNRPDEYILNNLMELTILQFQDSNRAQRSQIPYRHSEIAIRERSAASVIPVSSSHKSSNVFSKQPVSQSLDSSAAKIPPQNDESLESKEPFDDSSEVRDSSRFFSSRFIELSPLDQLNKLLRSRECYELFSYIADNPRLTDEQKLFAIREQMKQEAEVFGLYYNSRIEDIIEYVNSAARRHQIALAEIDFAKALIDELPTGDHQIDILQAEYDRVFDSDISEEEKSKALHNVIATWQNNNPTIIESITKISLENKNLKVIPKYMARFTDLSILSFNNNKITDISSLANLLNLKGLDLDNNDITDVSSLAKLVNLETLFLINNNITDIASLDNLVNLTFLDLSKNNITDVSSLAKLGKLEYLNLNGNNIINVYALYPLVNLKEFYLDSDNRKSSVEFPVQPIQVLDRKSAYLAAEFLLERKQSPFELFPIRPDISHLIRSIKLSHITQINNLLESWECQVFFKNPLFRHILDDVGLTNEKKLSFIKEQMKQKASIVENSIEDVDSDKKRYQIALAKVNFAKVLIKELLAKGHKIKSLQTKCDSIFGAFIPLEEKSRLLNNAITAWQLKNSNIIENITNISLEGKYISVIPKYITGFIHLRYLNLSYNKITDVSALDKLMKLERLDLENNDITDVSALVKLANLKELYLHGNKLVKKFSRQPVSQGLDSSAAKIPPQNDESLESKEPFDDSSEVRDSSPPFLSRFVESSLTAQLNKLLESRECQKLFSHIADNPRLTDKQKLFAIREQMQQEAMVFELPYSDVVEYIIEYVNGTARRRQMALAEIDFAKALIDELLAKGQQVDSLQTECGRVFDSGISKEEKAKALRDVIAKWQGSNPTIVENITKISLENKSLKVIPKYMAGFIGLKELDLRNNNITDISSLALRDLKKLYLNNNKITDISALSTLVELEELRLENNDINDVSALSTLVKLERLNLWDNNITDVSALATLLELKTLYLSNNNITDVSAFENLLKLKVLNLSSNSIIDISALAPLVKLEKLYLNSNKITDISALSALENLKKLYLNSNNITDISALSTLLELKVLNLSSNSIIDISALVALVKLERLDLNQNIITDVSALATLVELETLNLHRNNITNVSALAALVKLERLDLEDNNITDVSVLTALTELKVLGLWGNNITDVSALENLLKLEWIALGNNKITDVSPLAVLENLKKLYLGNNNIADVSALAALLNLETLYLNSNKIIDVSRLYTLVNLETLNLRNNNITNKNSLSAIEKLKGDKLATCEIDN